MTPPGMEEMTSQLQNLFSSMGKGKKKSRKLKVADALKLVRDEEAARLVNEEELKARALEAVEQHGDPAQRRHPGAAAQDLVHGGLSGHGRVSFAQGDSGFGPTGRGPVHCNPRHSPREGRFRSTG